MLNGGNSALLEELYERYLQDPGSVSPEWSAFFAGLERGNGHHRGELSARPVPPLTARSTLSDSIQELLESYRRSGHLAAHLDPLDIKERETQLFELERFGLSSSQLDDEFESGVPVLGRKSLKKIIEHFERTYCGSIGAEHFYIRDDSERNWLQERMEATGNSEVLPKWERLRLFEKVFQAEYFEKFLAQKYVGKKRFSLEGGEALIALLDTVIEMAGAQKLEHIVLGMAHRGRLNVLVNTMLKPPGVIFAEFDENYDPETPDYADVKYHLGFSSSVMTRRGREVRLSLAFNPSHLEAVGPVAIGSVRARQALSGDEKRERFMPIIIHGDAAFPGQGVVAETLNLMSTRGYTVGGTLHIVLNNQIGFTTLPEESRSTTYATDLAKGFQIPIFHVNGDDPEAVNRTVKLALEYRDRFKRDVIIDLVCYRRLGHNETDEPSFTQPLLYSKIKKHPSVVELYRKKLLEYDDIENEDVEFIVGGVRASLDDSFEQARARDVKMEAESLSGPWSAYSGSRSTSAYTTTGTEAIIPMVSSALNQLPDGFTMHPKLERLFALRQQMLRGEQSMDWGCAEMLAFGSILSRGRNIRLTGQDVWRGTFSHRHVVLRDIKTNGVWTPINSLTPEQGRIEAVNSPLSEYAALAYEFGYSISDPDSLVVWEAQFGDFVNGAQIVIDQFISSSEVKWRRLSGLVMLLPHGYEGQGPEHSSARVERFLQLAAGDNLQVCYPTSPAQYFHLLHRQVLAGYRKPLIIFSPKSLLRLPEAGSEIREITHGSFQPVLADELTTPDDVSRVIFCSGKFYYDLNQARLKNGVKDAALIRIEELYPFPEEELRKIIKSYPKGVKLIWAQEEPHNMGPLSYIEPLINQLVLARQKIETVARSQSPSPAAGLMKFHKQEQSQLVNRALAIT